MGTTKTESFTQNQLRMAQLAKALGHPARIAILEFLISKNDCICGDIVDELPLSQSTVSQHLKELKDAGLIKGEISGVKTCYCINEKAWKESQLLLNILFDSMTEKNNCC